MPPRRPNVGHLETGRTSRLVLSPAIAPEWFKKGAKVYFVPLHWKDDLALSKTRLLEAFLICPAAALTDSRDWKVSPTEALATGTDPVKLPEQQVEASLVYESEVDFHNGEWRLNCPPVLKALVDSQKRVYTTPHSLGLCVWSPPAFNEQFSSL